MSLWNLLNRPNGSSPPLNDLEAFYRDPTAAGPQASKFERLEYLLETPAPCQRHQFLVVYVHSAPEHHGRRQVVRSTWGNVSRWTTDSAVVTLRFVLGRPASDGDHQQRALVDEQTTHGDLVQLDFVDSYRNMTIKAIGALQWLNDFCRHGSRSAIPACTHVTRTFSTAILHLSYSAYSFFNVPYLCNLLRQAGIFLSRLSQQCLIIHLRKKNEFLSFSGEKKESPPTSI